MTSPTRLQKLLLLLVLLIPSWTAADVWAISDGGARITAPAAESSEDLLQSRGTEQALSGSAERESSGPDRPPQAPASSEYTPSGSDGCLANHTARRSLPSGCRPLAERLPYHATAPPTA